MIKWLWKANQPQAEMLAQWREALNIPLLAPLNEEEQQRLVSVASHLLQQKRLVPLQGLLLTPLMQARLTLLFALPVMELGAKWLDGFHEVLIYPSLLWLTTTGKMMQAWFILGKPYSLAKVGSKGQLF